jgi:two-component system chemotaxis sensor kinase CheA
MDDLISEFIAETNESLGLIDNDLVTLEQDPNNKEIIGNIFRLMHTIKGTCGFLGLSRLEKLAHHAENVMGRFRDGDLEVKEEYVTLILESVDQIKVIVEAIETTGSEPDGDDAGLIEKLDIVYEGREEGGDAPVEEAAQSDELSKEPNPANEGGLSDYDIAILQAAFNDTPAPESEEAPVDDDVEVMAEVPVVQEEPTKQVESKPVKAAPPAAIQSLRVNVDVLENLMTMVSELVLTRNQLMQIMRHTKDTNFNGSLQRLNHVVSDLQEGVMKTRMQPVGNAWAKLPRIIRDISIELEKKIDLNMEGQETELDRQVLDLIKDPLTHMVRNSADHGIETPAERLAVGKPEKGTIILNAFHEGGHIIMELKDDGKGLNTARIREKAIENGVATAVELDAMTAKQINQFIFAAGFSTAAEVTAVSGRGVGMDVVRTNIEKIGGTIDLDSVEGEGTTVSIKIPLTLAIVSALIIECAGERFAIPQLSVQELVMGSVGGVNKIETIKGAPVYRLRDHLLPLIHLDDLLNLKSKNESVTEAEITKKIEENAEEKSKEDDSKALAPVNDNSYIIVTKVGAYSFGIVVDKVYDTEEIVVKPVASVLRHIELFSGNTILGDGTVIMILDPGGIARATGDITMSDTVEKKDEAQRHKGLQKTSLLLFKAHDKTPKAVPLQLVSRLEDVDISRIEYSGDQMMVQYRGSLMPLIKFDPAMELNEGRPQPTLVFDDGRRTMGLMVSDIVDIMEDYINVQLNSNDETCLGSAIINEKATDIINVGYYLCRAYPDWFADHGEEDFSMNTNVMDTQKRVLIVDDSPFFRNMLAPILGVAGYAVETAEHPLQALDMMSEDEHFDAIISDIEMPEMNGFDFAEKIQAGKWKDVPLIALTSHATDKDVERGKAVGFDDYVAKFDRETLLNALSDALRHAKAIEDKAGVA